MTRPMPEYTQEAKKAVSEIAKQQTKWLKIDDEGNFTQNGNVLSRELEGVIYFMNPYLDGRVGDKRKKLPNVISDLDIPEGFKRRCLIKLETKDGARYQLDLAPSSFLYEFCPFFEGLFAELVDVTTRLETKEITIGENSYYAVTFEAVDVKQPELPEMSKEEDVPF